MTFKTALLPLTMPLVLAACLGSGGGSGSSSGQSGPLTLGSTPTADFTSFEAIEANSLVELPSGGGSVNYNADSVTSDPLHVVRTGIVSTDASSTVRILTGDALPEEDDDDFEVLGTRLRVNVPGRDSLVRDFFDEPVEVGVPGETDGFVVFELTETVDEVERTTDQLYTYDGDDLEYMTFGIWALGQQGESVDLGGSAWGALTPTAGDNPMPAAGTASYSGDMIGYNVLGGNTTVYVATAALAANFGAETVTLSSTGTTALDGSGDFLGLNIASSVGTISGSGFSGAELNLTGSAAFEGSFGGSFFGPDAAEAGGWFETRNTDAGANENDRYFGSFGGARGEIVLP